MADGRQLLVGLLLTSAIVGGSGACSGTKGELVVALQTDMSLPKDVDRVRVKVLRSGVQHYGRTFFVDPARDVALQIPSTIAIAAGDEENPTVEVQVVAFQGDRVRTLNKTITTIPEGRVAMLWVPIQWLCDGKAVWVSADSEDSADTLCPLDASGHETSCLAGQCVRTEVSAASLPNYAPEVVYGGNSAPGQSGACFPTEECFDAGIDVNADASCVVSLGISVSEPMNFALNTGPGGDGICSASSCYIPLDESPDFGWHELPVQQGRRRFQLPAAACEKVSGPNPVASSLRGSTHCATKTISTPTCGPWSSVKGNGSGAVVGPGAGEGGANGGVEGSSGMGGEPPGSGGAGGSGGGTNQGGTSGSGVVAPSAGTGGTAGGGTSSSGGTGSTNQAADCGAAPRNGDLCVGTGTCEQGDGCECDADQVTGCVDSNVVCGVAPADQDSCIGDGVCPEDANCICTLETVTCMAGTGGSGNGGMGGGTSGGRGGRGGSAGATSGAGGTGGAGGRGGSSGTAGA